ncbi:MAG: OmpA family protein [Nitrospinae bacterium]|nr:OmpA family protein [Nitrospinota bacterium]
MAARPVLDEVIQVVNKYPNYKIHIQGHTDDEPISTEMLATNWELSAARATAVLRYFIDKGAEPERMTAAGMQILSPWQEMKRHQGEPKIGG